VKDNDRYLKQQKSRRVWMYCRAVPKRMLELMVERPQLRYQPASAAFMKQGMFEIKNTFMPLYFARRLQILVLLVPRSF